MVQISSSRGDDGIGTTTPSVLLSLGPGAGIDPSIVSVTPSHLRVDAAPTSTTAINNTAGYILSVPNPAADSASYFDGFVADSYIPATSSVNYTGSQRAFLGFSNFAGIGTLAYQYGAYGVARNTSASGTVTSQAALVGNSINSGPGIVTSQYGLQASTSNGATGTVGSATGVYANVFNSGALTNGYGIYIDEIQGSNHWSIYAADATSPSFFAGNVGIGTTTPTNNLTVDANDQSTGITIQNDSSSAQRWPGITVNHYAGTFGGYGTIAFRTSRGSSGAPSPVSAGDGIGGLSGFGQYDTTSGHFGQGAAMQFLAEGNYSATSYPTGIAFRTVSSGSTLSNEQMRISSSGNVGITLSVPHFTTS